ncbi:MAG: cation transporter [Clostridia bacterium]|nr:cation transporter [Clostridia bacterium]
MTELLCSIFIKDRKNTKDAQVRRRYGTLSSVVGIILNIILAAGKYTAGLLFGAISLQADGINNLSDAGSQAVSLISFKISAKPADKEHPFGHARFEYIASMIVSFLILHIGFNTIVDSVKKIFDTEAQTQFSWIIIIVLGISVLVKIWLCLFNRKIARRIDSSMLRATAMDSLADACATFGVLVGMLVYKFTGFDIDAYMGAIVAVLIIVAGVRVFLETKSSLLGERPSDELVEAIHRIVGEYPEALGIHDMMVHSYGPGKTVATFHVEVDRNCDLIESHDMIDNIERHILSKLGILTTIHMDPIVTDNEEVNRLKIAVRELVKEIDGRLDIHDFRCVFGVTHTNILFDISTPFDVKLSDAELCEQISAGIKGIDERYFAVVTVDRC